MHATTFSSLLFLACSLLLEVSVAFSAPRSPTKGGRRDFLLQELITVTSISSALLIPTESKAFPFQTVERRQLELCTATILRLKYWSENVALSIQRNIDRESSSSSSATIIKGPYMEARLGAKAALTGKVGGGANGQVYQIASFQLKACVKDALFYSNEQYTQEIKTASRGQKGQLKIQKQIVDNAAEDIIESIAAVVEFDGLDNVQDPSPRSSLALAQYTDVKATYVKRILLERTIPACNTFVRGFGTDKMRLVERFVARTYPNELPLSLRAGGAAGAAGG